MTDGEPECAFEENSESEMDVLTHVFLPLTVAYGLRQELFETPAHLSLAGFGLLSDVDKFLGHPGLLHSFVTLGPICLVILAAEQWVRGRLVVSPLVVAFVLSHPVLDFVDGGPIWPLVPLVDTGIGLQYPVRVAFGEGPVGLALRGPLVTLETGMERSPGFRSYGFINGFGAASLLSFLVLYLGSHRDGRDE